MLSRSRTTFTAALILLAACTPPAPPPATQDTPPTTTGAATGEAAEPPEPPEEPVPVEDVTASAPLKTLVSAPDRAQEDRDLDQGRRPAELLEYFKVTPGMKVAEIGAGGGYTTEIFARAVGPTGVVYGQNSRFILDRFAEKPWSARLEKTLMKNVVRVDREFDDPLPPEAKDLDAVLIVLFYHDLFWLDADRAKMNQAIFRALKPGGVYAVVDHSGRPGTGSTEVKTLHRIEEKLVRKEIRKAGFKLVSEARFLRNPADTRDWNASPSAAAERRGTTDRFVLKFVKP
jgi:predicted methyltransferase